MSVRDVLAAVFGRSQAPEGWHEAAQREYDEAARAAARALPETAWGDVEYQRHLAEVAGAQAWIRDHPGPGAGRYDPTAQQAGEGLSDRIAGAFQGVRDRLTGTAYEPMKDGEYRVLHPGGREYEASRRYEAGRPARNAYERGVYAEHEADQAAEEQEIAEHYQEMADQQAWEREHPEEAVEQRRAELRPEAWAAHNGGDHYYCAEAGIDDVANPDPRDIAPGDDEIEAHYEREAALAREGTQLEAWEYGPDAARYEPALVQADEVEDRHVSPAGDPVLAELAEMDDAAVDTAIAEEEERAERSWERWMDEMGQEEDPEARYVAGRDPRSEAEAQQFAEWDAASQAEAVAHDARAAWDFTGTGPESATETETSWAGAGFTQPGPEEPEDAMTPEQEAAELVGPAADPDMSDEQRARAAEYSGQYVRGQADAQNGTAAAPERGTEQEAAGYSAGQRWGQSHPAAYQQARGDQRQADRQMEA